jgi:hypothetical protein
MDALAKLRVAPFSPRRTGIAELRARAAALAQQAGRKTISTENAGPKIRELQARAAGFALADTP